MTIEKYIIDKSDLTALLRGETLAIQPKRNIRGFCVEITGDLTNGDVIKALFPDMHIEYWAEYSTYNIELPNDNDVKHFSYHWWNAPYKAESEV